MSNHSRRARALRRRMWRTRYYASILPISILLAMIAPDRMLSINGLYVIGMLVIIPRATDYIVKIIEEGEEERKRQQETTD